MNKSVFRIFKLPQSNMSSKQYKGMVTPSNATAYIQATLIDKHNVEFDKATIAKRYPSMFRDGDNLVNGVLWSTSHQFHIFRWSAAGRTGELIHEHYHCENDAVWYPD